MYNNPDTVNGKKDGIITFIKIYPEKYPNPDRRDKCLEDLTNQEILKKLCCSDTLKLSCFTILMFCFARMVR